MKHWSDAEKAIVVTATDRAVPTGEVTFLFTDLEGSTSLWERSPDAMDGALAEQDRRLREVFGRRNGYIFTTAGDSFAVAFDDPVEALAAAIESQRRLIEPCGELLIRIRIGLHTGTAVARDGDYFGAVVNRAARLMSSAHGGQVIVSVATGALLDHVLPDGVDLVDLGKHRLKDLLSLEHVFQVRHPDLDDDFPPLRTLEGPWSNLPAQLTSFVGRERELADVGLLLGAHRLVTMTGSGGAGKTRLSLQVAANSIEQFPDGVRFVELANVPNAQFICDEIAVAVSAREAPDESLIEQIAAKIGSQRLLLILDNCEHLIDDVAAVVNQLLRRCVQLKILATSRERLNSSGEVAYRVPSLAMPNTAREQSGPGSLHQATALSGTRTDPREARDYDAVQLFTERAMLARADFELTAKNVDAVVAICIRLDGIPLALELAAARLRVLSPGQVAARLDERFQLLTNSSRGSLERHRTLGATIDWSYEHLTEPEQAVFRRASVFAGTFDIDAAESVCAGHDIESFEVLDHLAGLIDKSMLVPEETADGATYYRLLESMRQYGATKVTEHDEDQLVGLAHTHFYVGLCEHFKVMHRGEQLAEALDALDRDVENVRTALRYAFDNNHHDEAAKVIGSIAYLWYVGGTFVEGIGWCRELFDKEPDLPDITLADALHAYSLLLGSWSDYGAGVAMLIREVELRRRIGDPARLAAALNNLGNLLNDLGRMDEGDAALRESVEQYRAAGEPATLPLATIAFGRRDQGLYDEAAALFSESLEEATTAGSDYGIALARSGLGELATIRGNTNEARMLLEDARSEFERLGVRPGVNNLDIILAKADIADGEIVDAAHRLMSALSEPDAHWYEAAKYWILQLTASIIDDQEVATELLAVAAGHYEAAGIPQPLWAIEHFEKTKQALGDAAAEASTGAIPMGVTDPITAANDALQTLIDAAGDDTGARGR
jgi:predicted ATPase/class 3 adenylate cyclase